jgi:hypothetical protein
MERNTGGEYVPDAAFSPKARMDWMGNDIIIIKSTEEETLYLQYSPLGIGWDYHRIPTSKLKWSKNKDIKIDELTEENEQLKEENLEMMKALIDLRVDVERIKMRKKDRLEKYNREDY